MKNRSLGRERGERKKNHFLSSLYGKSHVAWEMLQKWREEEDEEEEEDNYRTER